jgi:hypothetical protein
VQVLFRHKQQATIPVYPTLKIPFEDRTILLAALSKSEHLCLLDTGNVLYVLKDQEENVGKYQLSREEVVLAVRWVTD